MAFSRDLFSCVIFNDISLTLLSEIGCVEDVSCSFVDGTTSNDLFKIGFLERSNEMNMNSSHVNIVYPEWKTSSFSCSLCSMVGELCPLIFEGFDV